MAARKSTAPKHEKNESLEQWIWDAACFIRGAKYAPKYKDFILPLIFAKRLCDVFDDELKRVAAEVGSRKKAFQLAKRDLKLVRFFLPLEPADPEQPAWSVIRKLSSRIGEGVTAYMRGIAKKKPPLQGIIDRGDFTATTHGQRDIDDDRLSHLIEKISEKRLGLEDVKADNQACASITPTDEVEVSSQFQYHWFKYNYENLRKLRPRANQPNMNATLICSFPLAVPSIADQRGIVAALSELDGKYHLLQQKRSSLSEFFRTFLHELMTAKIWVPESADNL